jgi:hypothetical protein
MKLLMYSIVASREVGLEAPDDETVWRYVARSTTWIEADTI